MILTYYVSKIKNFQNKIGQAFSPNNIFIDDSSKIKLFSLGYPVNFQYIKLFSLGYPVNFNKTSS
jgi:hypothetical protein